MKSIEIDWNQLESIEIHWDPLEFNFASAIAVPQAWCLIQFEGYIWNFQFLIDFNGF
jgi:hypothetical protein